MVRRSEAQNNYHSYNEEESLVVDERKKYPELAFFLTYLIDSNMTDASKRDWEVLDLGKSTLDVWSFLLIKDECLS